MGWQDDPVVSKGGASAAPWANDPVVHAAPQSGTGIPMLDSALGVLGKFGRYAIGSTEAAGSMASGAIAKPISDLAALGAMGNNALGIGAPQDPASVKAAAQNAMTYQPRSDSGKAIVGGIGSAADATLGRFARSLGNSGAEDARLLGADPSTQDVVRSGASEFGNQIPGILGAKYTPKAPSVTSTLNETAAQSLKDAGDLGLVVTPSDAGMTGTSAVAKAAESSGSMTKLQQAATKINASRIVDGVKEDLGVPSEQELTPAVIKQRSADADSMYQAVRDADKNQIPVKSPNGVQLRNPDGTPMTKPAGPIQLGDDYQAAVAKIGNDRANPDFATSSGPEVQALKDELASKNQLSTDGTVSKINDLREEARGNLNRVGATNQDKALGRAQMQAAGVLENQLSTYLQNQPGVYQAMVAARALKAKLGTVKEAFDSGSGNIDASVLNRDLENGVPLSGNMEKIGRVYGQFSKVMGDPTKIATGHNSIVDTGLIAQGALRALHGDMSGLAEAGLGAARPLARKVALSDSYQNMLRTGQPSPGILSGLSQPAAGVTQLAALQQQPDDKP